MYVIIRIFVWSPLRVERWAFGHNQRPWRAVVENEGAFTLLNFILYLVLVSATAHQKRFFDIHTLSPPFFYFWFHSSRITLWPTAPTSLLESIPRGGAGGEWTAVSANCGSTCSFCQALQIRVCAVEGQNQKSVDLSSVWESTAVSRRVVALAVVE